MKCKGINKYSCLERVQIFVLKKPGPPSPPSGAGDLGTEDEVSFSEYGDYSSEQTPTLLTCWEI